MPQFAAFRSPARGCCGVTKARASCIRARGSAPRAAIASGATGGCRAAESAPRVPPEDTQHGGERAQLGQRLIRLLARLTHHVEVKEVLPRTTRYGPGLDLGEIETAFGEYRQRAMQRSWGVRQREHQ